MEILKGNALYIIIILCIIFCVYKVWKWKSLSVDVTYDKTEEKIDKYRKLLHLFSDDKNFISNMEFCLQSPHDYFEKNIDNYDDRGIDEDEVDTIIWLAIVDELININVVCEFDWKELLDDFLFGIKILADKYSFDVKDEWFSENDDISSWCKTLNIKLSEHNLCLGAMDIDSDSYVLFICENNKFNSMVNLSRDLERRIDLAENM